ncbi:zinc finger protein Xfin-like isoform X2 [Sabethes cyaneus]|uniref:zinc finger protein Xfin-like isoform X2 n=1 Tax=Sabethes cyaneus TaxID=53552 RepID=UPI00237D9F18|nr:zinc finger protein Xfin-like isoform X2 [Sabethes cyaneus]
MENREPTISACSTIPAAAASSSSTNSATNIPESTGNGNSNGGTVTPDGDSSLPVISTLCRICMYDFRSQGGRLLESLSRTTIESKTLYSMLVTVCSPLAQCNNEGMPDKICSWCKARLVQAYKLYETCIKSDDRIRKLLQTHALTGGVPIKQEIIDDEDDDVELTNAEMFCDAQVKSEEPSDQDYLFDEQFYEAALSNLRIQSVHNGPEVLVQLQEHNYPSDFGTHISKPVFECEKFVKVTAKGHICLLCGRDFKYFSYFKQHALAQHDPEKPHKCEKCKYTFKTEQRLFIHMRTHIEAEIQPAAAVEPAKLQDLSPEDEPEPDQELLDDSINEEDSPDLNISINPDTGEKVYTCLVCHKQLSTFPLYNRHRTVHTVRGRPFECDICHYRFAMKFSYNAHMQRHEQGKDPAQPATFKCLECDEVFFRRKLLNLHVATEHERSLVSLNKTAPAAILTSNISDGRHGHTCPLCPETFNRESVLNNHMKMHELEAAQLKHSEVCFVCTVCGLECETRKIFDSHIKTHGDVQLPSAAGHSQTEADLSDDEHNTQNGDDSAIASPAKPDTKVGAKCELCSKTFPYACNLKQHKIIHHSELKPHECSICFYRFEYEGTLLRHMQKHSKPESNMPSVSAQVPAVSEDTIVAPPGATLIYKCKLCSARFQKQKSMTWHLKTHRSIVASEGNATVIHQLEQSLLQAAAAAAAATAASTSQPARTTSPSPGNSCSPSLAVAGSKSPTSTAKQDLQVQPQTEDKLATVTSTPKMYKCGYCPQNLDSEDAYYQHLKGHRVRRNDSLPADGDTPPLKKKRSWIRSGDHHRCNLCQKQFTFRSQLQQHTALHHQPGKPYECQKCHYSFVHKLNLKRHELTHLEEERLASEDDPSIQLLEDESFNADLEDMVEPVLEEKGSADEGNEGPSSSGEGGTTPATTAGPPKKNKCVVCSSVFQREDQLIEHLKTHIERIKVTKQETQTAKKILSDDNDRKCKLCLKVFKFSCQLKQHVQMHHAKEKPFECNICKYRFEFKGHMIRHKAINHAEEVAAEEAEMDELPSKITTPTMNPDGSEVYQCPVCPMHFVKQRSLTWHLKTHSTRRFRQDEGVPSTSSGEVMQCRFCSRTFRDVYELKAHMATHVGSSAGGSTSLSTTLPDAEHSLFGSGLDMMLQDFPDTMENHGADPLFDESNLELVLEDGFDSDDLSFNMRYQDTAPLPPAKRSLPASENSVYDVAEPGASTTPAKGKIICELCKKDFLYSCNLKQHMQLHHAKDKPFECKICFYRFEYSGHLVRHIRQNHDKSQADEAAGDAVEKNFVCTFCSELFEQKSQLNTHLHIYHKGEKQFKCDFCPASFAYKKAFDSHREECRINKRLGDSATGSTASTSKTSGATSFSCNFCKKTFSSAQKVDNHVCFQ